MTIYWNRQVFFFCLFLEYFIFLIFLIGSAVVSTTPNNPKLDGPEDIPHPRSHSISALQTNESPSHQIKSDKSSYGSTATTNPSDTQLKYENDRLKLALAQRYFFIII